MKHTELNRGEELQHNYP